MNIIIRRKSKFLQSAGRSNWKWECRTNFEI